MLYNQLESVDPMAPMRVFYKVLSGHLICLLDSYISYVLDLKNKTLTTCLGFGCNVGSPATQDIAPEDEQVLENAPPRSTVYISLTPSGKFVTCLPGLADDVDDATYDLVSKKDDAFVKALMTEAQKAEAEKAKAQKEKKVTAQERVEASFTTAGNGSIILAGKDISAQDIFEYLRDKLADLAAKVILGLLHTGKMHGANKVQYCSVCGEYVDGWTSCACGYNTYKNVKYYRLRKLFILAVLSKHWDLCVQIILLSLQGGHGIAPALTNGLPAALENILTSQPGTALSICKLSRTALNILVRRGCAKSLLEAMHQTDMAPIEERWRRKKVVAHIHGLLQQA